MSRKAKNAFKTGDFIKNFKKEITPCIIGTCIILVLMFSRNKANIAYDFSFYWWQIALFIFGLLLILFGIKKVQRKKAQEKFEILKAFYQYKDFVSFEQMGYFLQISTKDAAKLIAEFEGHHFFTTEKVDWQNLIFWPKGLKEIDNLPASEVVLYPKKIKNPLLSYIIGLTWILYALAFPLYRTGDFIALILSSAVAFAFGKVLWQSTTVFEEKTLVQAKATGNAIVDEFIKKSMDFTKEMKTMSLKLKKTNVGLIANEIFLLSEKLFNIVEMDDQKIRNIQPFIDYYLPTTLKVLNEYEKISSLPQEGKNVAEMTGKIEEVLDKVKKAFTAEIDRVYGEDTLDLSAEITVLNHMIETEILDKSI